ncbi:hypothetical protein LCGC14_2337520 [marine sediment metagenome]|uniref:DUF86 domain-containing protein n=1 Tax=marine sediment metagenome TaxID=412755 RepID=A0A0F9CCW8_9ZZZZ
MRRDNKLFLKDIYKSCEYILEFIKGMDFNEFKRDEKTLSAVIRKFEIIGESVRYLPDRIKKSYLNVPWKEMAGMRDHLIHGYFGIDYKIVWDTIKEKIPDLISIISQILNELEE